MENNIITPIYFPWDIVTIVLTKVRMMVTKVGISDWWKIDYMCYDGEDYYWLDEIQIEREEKRTIWFNIATNAT